MYVYIYTYIEIQSTSYRFRLKPKEKEFSVVKIHISPTKLKNKSFINFKPTSHLLNWGKEEDFIFFSFSRLSKENVRRHVLEKNRSPREKEKTNNGLLSKHLKKVYPISLHKSISTLSLSSLSLSLSQNSNDSSLTDSTISLDQKISLALQLIRKSKHVALKSAVT